jgi:hypothetical protein
LRAIGGDIGHKIGGRKRRRLTKGVGGALGDPRRNKSSDPLQSFSDPGADSVGGSEGNQEIVVGAQEKIYTKFDDTGEATAGRRVWKMRHRKGEFSSSASSNKGHKHSKKPARK